MFDNAGKKIEAFAKFMFWLILLAGVIIVIFGVDNDVIKRSVLQAPIIVLGILNVILAYPISLLIYGFGQLVDDNHATRRTVSAPTSAGVSRTASVPTFDAYDDPELIALIQKLENKGHLK